jgi:hypothetical protein
MKEEELVQEILAMKQEIAELKRRSGNGLFNRISNIRYRLSKRVLIPVGIACFLVATTFAFAASIPNSFTSGDPISASQMNENFSYIIDRLWEVTGANLYYNEGNVGIGTSSPSQKLEVIGTVDADAFTVNGTSVGTSTSTYWNESAGDLSYTLGSVGIGTSSPSQKLEVIGTVDADAFTVNGTSVGTSTSTYWNESAGDLSYTLGSVGIGTATPASDVAWAIPALDISGTRGTAMLRTTNAAGIATLRMVGPNGATVDDWHMNMTAGASSYIQFYMSGMPTGLVVKNDGNVGIGTTAPGSKLSVVGLPANTSAALATGGTLAGAVCIDTNGDMYIDTDNTCS